MIRFWAKMNFRLLQLFTLVTFSVAGFAQSTTEMKDIFNQAESYYLYEEYDLANQLYLLIESPDNFNIQYKIGTCYLFIPGEKEKAISYLESAVKNSSYDSKPASFKEKKAPLDSYFFLAKAYMINNELEKALTTLQAFQKLVKETEDKGGMKNLGYIDQEIQACRNAIKLKEVPVQFSKSILGPDFTEGSINENPAVSFDGNTIVYTERRGVVNVIFFSKFVGGKWQPPIEITSDLKAGEDCSSCSLNKDGTLLFLYKTDNYDGNIYSSEFIDGEWAPIKKLNKNINTKFYESHAAISADGKKLYFTSNREGGIGSLDIYVSEKDATGDWGPAINLGTAINTDYNEDTPFVSPNDSLIYFCSEGHSAMGGYDIFLSHKTDSTWKTPLNLGFPLNTTDDDKFFQPANKGRNGYFSMTTDYKKKDIFYITFDTVSPGIIYEKINLSDIPEISEADSATLIRNLIVSDLSDISINDSDILYYTVQVMALYNPVDISYFKYIPDIEVMYNDKDRFYRYTVGNFATKEEAELLKQELFRKGYPNALWVKKVSK